MSKLNSSKESFYFVHIAKCMGTTIYSQLPKSYNEIYYGEENKECYNHISLKKYPSIKRVCLDHLTIQEAYDINLINDYDISNKDFIVIWRNPIDRFISHVNWMRGLGKEKNQNSDIIRNSKNEIFCEYDDYPKFYYQFGLYYKWISRFFEIFGRNNIKIVTLEALINDRNQVLNSCYEFLDLEKLNNIPELQSNKTKKIIFPNIYHFLRKSISGKMKYTQCVKIILPKFFRIKIKSYIKNSLVNWKGRKENFTKFSKNDRLVLKDLYIKDVEKLKRKINYDFKEWEDFKKVR